MELSSSWQYLVAASALVQTCFEGRLRRTRTTASPIDYGRTLVTDWWSGTTDTLVSVVGE
eukprot:scaffold3164_cov376-Prasinococcus_capsulatus_cf.AAC.6